jgi:hypothetical protein
MASISVPTDPKDTPSMEMYSHNEIWRRRPYTSWESPTNTNTHWWPKLQ